jgi:hypothetical protein
MRESAANDVGFESVTDVEGSIATGISVIVPAKKILEILHHPELVQKRADKERARMVAGGTTTSD